MLGAQRPEVNWCHSLGTRLVYLRQFLYMDLIKQAIRRPMSPVELISAFPPPLAPAMDYKHVLPCLAF